MADEKRKLITASEQRVKGQNNFIFLLAKFGDPVEDKFPRSAEYMNFYRSRDFEDFWQLHLIGQTVITAITSVEQFEKLLRSFWYQGRDHIEHLKVEFDKEEDR